MKFLAILLSYGRPSAVISATLIMLAISTGCEDSDPGDDPTIGYIYVNADDESDTTRDGTPEHPFRSITRGIAESRAYYTVRVAPGLYDESIGEVFPIRLKAAVSVIGDVRNKGQGNNPTRIEGTGSYNSESLGEGQEVTVVCPPGATFSGFSVNAPSGTAVWCEGEDSAKIKITGNTISGLDYGVIITGSANVKLQNNLISENTVSGVETFVAVAPVIRDCTITENGSGITIRNASFPDLGTGYDMGNNNLSSNTNCDLNNMTDNLILSIGNDWDVNQFLFSVEQDCTGGANIANAGNGSVLYQYIPLADAPLFAGRTRIELIVPGRGTIVTSTEPRFVWVASGCNLVFLGVFSKPIIVRNNSIRNKNDLLWAWHSGMEKGRIGDVNFGDGVNVTAGKLNYADSPLPLENGKSYYWALWTWSNDGARISHSSEQSYFIVGN